MKIFSMVIAAVVAALMLYMAYFNPGGNEDKRRDAAVIKAVLPDMTGKMQAIEQWRGKVLVVNFWASWCPPCRAEIPGFIDLQKKYQSSGLTFVGIAVDSADKAGAFAKKIGVNYPVLIDQDSSVLNLAGLPYTLVFDRKGEVVSTHVGAWPEEELDGIVGKLLRN